MFFYLRNLAARDRRNRQSIVRCVPVIGIAFWMFVLNACGGGSGSNSNNSAVGNAGPSGSAALTLSATLPPASTGSNYSGDLTASGGTAPYTFAVVSGQLPQGVALADNTGAVSGTPTASGSFSFGVSVSDSKGLSKQQSLQISVTNPGTQGPTSPAPPTSGGNGTTLSNLQKAAGWAQFGQGPPSFVDCSPSPCDGIAFSMTQGVQSPSLSGQATEFYAGVSTPFSDALFNNHLIGPLSSQGMFDPSQTQVSGLQNFTYDVSFYGDNLNLAQALEFDINQFFGNMGFIYGHECRIASGNQWDVWDDQNAKWVPTGVPCFPNSNSWNHVTLKVQRTSDNHLTYQSITLNGNTTTLNWTFGHGAASNWYGLTVNFQMDGNYRQDSYNVYLDNLTVSYQ